MLTGTRGWPKPKKLGEKLYMGLRQKPKNADTWILLPREWPSQTKRLL